MKKLAFSSLALVSVLASAAASAQDIVGSWKQSAFYQKVVSSGEKRFPFGEKIVGRSMYTKEGTFCTMATGIDRKQGAGLPPMRKGLVYLSPCTRIAAHIVSMVQNSWGGPM